MSTALCQCVKEPAWLLLLCSDKKTVRMMYNTTYLGFVHYRTHSTIERDLETQVFFTSHIQLSDP